MDSDTIRGERVKPSVDLNRAFEIFIKEGNAGLKEYMKRLNDQYFDEEGNPTTPDSKVAEQLNPDEMTYEALIAELKRRGIDKYVPKKKKVKRKDYNPDTGKLEEKEVEIEEPVPAKFNKEEAIARLKQEIGEAPAPKERVTEKLKLIDMKEFPDDVLYTYLRKNFNSESENKTAIMQGETFQGRLLVNPDGTPRSGAEIRNKVEDELRDKFPIIFRQDRPKQYIDELVRLGLRSFTSRVAEDASALTRMSSTQIIDEAKEDSDVNDILGMFTEKGTKLNYKVFELYFRQFAPKRETRRNIKWNNYVNRTYRLGFTREGVDEAIDILENKIPDYFVPILFPFKAMLVNLKDKKETGQGQYRVSRLRASEIIGRVDTKQIKKRAEIYEYWKGKSKEFDDFKTAHNNFMDAMDKLDGEYSSELESTFKEFKAVKIDNLNYIQRHDRVDFEDIDNIEQKSVALLRSFLNDIRQMPPDRVIFTDEETSRDDVSRYGELETDNELIDEESELRAKINSLSNKKVDPLYAYALKEGFTNELSAGAVASKQLSEIKRRLKTGLVLIEMENLIPRIDSFIKDLEKMESGNLKDLFLPVSEVIEGYEGGKKINDDVAEYLSLFAEFIEYGDDFDRRSKDASSVVGQGERKVGGKTVREAASPRVALGRRGKRKTHLTEFKELDIASKFNSLLEQIVNFFIEPSRSKYKPTDEALPYIKKVGSRKIENIVREPKAGDSPFIHLLRMESDDWRLSISDLKNISKFMQLLTSLNVGSKQKELVSETFDLADMIDDLFEGEMTEMVNVEFGNFLSGLFEDANLGDVKFGLGGKKKDTKEWAEDYKASKLYPFESIFNHLVMNKEKYKEMQGATQLIDRILTAENDLNITKSAEERLVLKAHDEIRKMMGKPTYYGLSKVEDYNAVAEAIHMMNSKYNVDITAMDVENIVKEFDSMTSIGTKYGIPQEGVYFLKANFR